MNPFEIDGFDFECTDSNVVQDTGVNGNYSNMFSNSMQNTTNFEDIK